jgi:hypothetical protein
MVMLTLHFPHMPCPLSLSLSPPSVFLFESVCACLLDVHVSPSVMPLCLRPLVCLGQHCMHN